MATIPKVLGNIANGNSNFCCLCLSICDARDLICNEDEASFLRNNITEDIAMSDLIIAVLGVSMKQYVETLENICIGCAKSLFNSYTFIQTCNANASLLTNSLEGLNTGIQNITKPEAQQSLFVSINLANFSSEFLYDSQHIFTPEMALKRYLVLKKPEEKTNKYGFKDSEMLRDSTNQQIFQCNICLKIFQSMLKLRNHFLRVHIKKNQNVYKCLKTFRTKALTQKTGVPYRLSCRECGENYSSRSLLKNHQMNHKMTIVCQDCGRTYKNKSTFKNHVQLNICKQERRHSPLQAKYTCDYCNKKYTQKVSLRVHIQFEHGNYKAHICEWCGKKFWAQSRLKAHIVKHTRERNFTCPTCHRKFVTKESLLYHTRLHTGDKPYKCSECSSTFLSASRRSDHFKRYHDNAQPDLECDICYGKFRTGNVLLKHKRIHEEMLLKKNPSKMHTHHIHDEEVKLKLRLRN